MNTIKFTFCVFFLSFYLSLGAEEVSRFLSKVRILPHAQPEEEPEDDVWNKASKSDPHHEWYNFKDESMSTKDLELNVQKTTTEVPKKVRGQAASLTRPFPPSSAYLTLGAEQPRDTHTVPSELKFQGSKLKLEGDRIVKFVPSSSLYGDTRQNSEGSTGWVSLDSFRSFVGTSTETLPPVTDLRGIIEGRPIIFSPFRPRYQNYRISTTAEDQKRHQYYQSETGLKSTVSTYDTTTSSESPPGSVSTIPAVSLDENTHQNNTVFEIDLRLCSESEDNDVITADHGTVSVLRTNSSGTLDASITCVFRIIVPSSRFVSVSFDESFSSEELNAEYYVINCNVTEHFVFGTYSTKETPPDLYSSTNCLKFGVTSYTPFKRTVLLTFISNPSQLTLNLTFLTEKIGFVTTPFFDGISSNYPPNLKVSTTIKLPHQYSSILVSFDSFALKYETECITFSEIDNSTSKDNPSYRICGTDTVHAKLFNTSLQIEFVSVPQHAMIGFKMLFSFHTHKDEPRFVRTGRYNCTSHYERLKRHLECNLLQECESNQDELGCWYSSEKCADAIAYGDRCYSYVIWTSLLTWNEANDICLLRKSDLVSLNTIEEMHAVLKTIGQVRKRRWLKVMIGLRTSNPNLPKMYRRTLQWNDGKSALDFAFADLKLKRYPSCGIIFDDGTWKYEMTDCNARVTSQFLCEFYPIRSSRTKEGNTANISNSDILLSPSYANKQKMTLRLPALATCPNGHVTHDFLSCDPATDCFAETYVDTCETENGGVIAPFTCEDGVQTVAFTLVCDHRQDCRDGSDEDRCVFEACEGFLCDNTQCVRVSEVCDGMDHCLTGRDEDRCSEVTSLTSSDVHRVVMNTGIVTLDGHGNYEITFSNQSQKQVLPPFAIF